MPLSLAAHLTSHSDDRHYVPDFPNCTADYKDPDALRAHKLSHTDDPTPYTCDVDGCDKAYSSSGMLGKHKKTHRLGVQFPWLSQNVQERDRSARPQAHAHRRPETSQIAQG